jgi:hypothetical protein
MPHTLEPGWLGDRGVVQVRDVVQGASVDMSAPGRPFRTVLPSGGVMVCPSVCLSMNTCGRFVISSGIVVSTLDG